MEGSYVQYLENGTCGPEVYASENKNNEYSVLVDGYGDYRFCILTSDCLTGYKYDGEQEELIDWAASDIQPQTVQMVGENCFVIRNWGEYGVELCRLTRKRQSEIKEKVTIQSPTQAAQEKEKTKHQKR